MCGQEPVRRQEGLQPLRYKEEKGRFAGQQPAARNSARRLQPLCSQKEVQPVRDQEEKGALLERIDRPREI